MMTSAPLILGTAGHIDHGKTSLVRALTGIDCDRLPEEKKRGITIDLGFADLSVPAAGGGVHHLGVVDVPGHERFIKNMLAGATGVDIALLVIAADDTVMPQTREHLAILDLLGLKRGIVVLTKSDLVEPGWLDMVEDDLRGLLAGTFLATAPVARVSSITGAGIPELKALIGRMADAAATERMKVASQLFRMPIDRCFTRPGAGTVVTGTVWSGMADLDAELELVPGHQRLRVRALHSHGAVCERIERGMRAAINLAGIHHTEVLRGQELATPGYLKASRVITVQLRTLKTAPWPIANRMRVRLHLGTQEALAAVKLLDGKSLGPGQSGWAQLFCREPVVGVCGQPLVLRAESPMITLGGGIVVQPVTRRIRIHDVLARQRLADLAGTDPVARTAAAVAFHETRPWTPDALCGETGLSPDALRTTLDTLTLEKKLVKVAPGGRAECWVSAEVLAQLETRALAALKQLHLGDSLAVSFERDRVASLLGRLGPDWAAVILQRLVQKGQVIAGRGGRVAHAEMAPKLSASQRKVKEALLTAYLDSGLSPPTGDVLAQTVGFVGKSKDLAPIQKLLVVEGELVHIQEDFYLHATHEAAARTKAAAMLMAKPMTVSELREGLDASRKYVVPLCEFWDRSGFTLRSGDFRSLKAATGPQQV